MRPATLVPVAIVALLATATGAGAAWAAAGPAPADGEWRPPTSGSVTRGFAFGADPFAAGNHRGADFAAPPGTPVRAVCSGRVVVAGRIGTSGGVVTLACGRWRVSLLPLATIGPHVGVRLDAGDPIGTAEASGAHAGIHVGIRRAGTRFGYVDPLRFLGRPPRRTIPVMGPPPPRPRARPAPAPPRAATGPAPPRAATASAPPRAATAPAPPRAAIALARARAAIALTGSRAAPDARPLAPWPAWAGLAALLLAATTRGVRWRRSGGVRRRRPGGVRWRRSGGVGWRRRANRVRTRPPPRAPAALAGPARDDLGP